jgi:hypothetical protein
MSHFPTPFDVSFSADKGLVRLSVRSSDSHVREHWLEPWEVKSAISADDYSNWVGDGRIQIKVEPPSGSVALLTSGSRDVVRSTRGNVRALMAQLRAALRGLGERAVSKDEIPQVDQLRVEIGQVAQQARSSELKIVQLLEQLADRVDRLATAQQALAAQSGVPIATAALPLSGAVAPALSPAPATSEGDPVFIPKPNLNIEGSVFTSESTSSSVEAATKALKEIR